jgi:hypothetical protein
MKIFAIVLAVLFLANLMKAVSLEAFYLFLILAAIAAFLRFRARNRSADRGVDGSSRTRTRRALRAVRRKEMTLREASEHYRVSEHAISKLHTAYFIFVD